MTELLRQYYFVGGMPGVVSKFIENTDLQQVRTLQRDILEAYRRDISKHTSAAESTRIREVLDSLPSQLHVKTRSSSMELCAKVAEPRILNRPYNGW